MAIDGLFPGAAEGRNLLILIYKDAKKKNNIEKLNKIVEKFNEKMRDYIVNIRAVRDGAFEYDFAAHVFNESDQIRSKQSELEIGHDYLNHELELLADKLSDFKVESQKIVQFFKHVLFKSSHAKNIEDFSKKNSIVLADILNKKFNKFLNGNLLTQAEKDNPLHIQAKAERKHLEKIRKLEEEIEQLSKIPARILDVEKDVFRGHDKTLPQVVDATIKQLEDKKSGNLSKISRAATDHVLRLIQKLKYLIKAKGDLAELDLSALDKDYLFQDKKMENFFSDEIFRNFREIREIVLLALQVSPLKKKQEELAKLKDPNYKEKAKPVANVQEPKKNEAENPVQEDFIQNNVKVPEPLPEKKIEPEEKEPPVPLPLPQNNNPVEKKDEPLKAPEAKPIEAKPEVAKKIEEAPKQIKEPPKPVVVEKKEPVVVKEEKKEEPKQNPGEKLLEPVEIPLYKRFFRKLATPFIWIKNLFIRFYRYCKGE